VSELRQYLRSIARGVERIPDLLVVATDANCLGYARRRREIEDVTGDYRIFTICAIPDPHVERWLLLDTRAFKVVLGHGCGPPDQKCERDRYKRALSNAVRQAGLIPLLGGLEHAEDLVAAMDLEQVGRLDPSLGHFLSDMRSVLRQWREE
jgi:hypothetical protein